jgi:hypothetical protein
MRSPMGEGALRLASAGGTLRVAERRILFRTSVLFWFAANPEAEDGATAEGGGVAGRGGEAGLLVAFWKKV